jgi:hypothetical protein
MKMNSFNALSTHPEVHSLYWTTNQCTSKYAPFEVL